MKKGNATCNKPMQQGSKKAVVSQLSKTHPAFWGTETFIAL